MLSRRVQSLQLLLPMFYVSAGMLKLNPEWLSGGALLKATWIPHSMLYISMLAAIGMELVLAPLLIFVKKGTLIWWFSLAILIFFHLVSWHLVGFFYPCVMFCLLSYYLFCDPEPAKWPGRVSLIALALVTVPQLMRTFLPGVGLEGKARMISLNMLDTMPICQSSYIVHTGDSKIVTSLDTETFAPRIRCDPILFINELNRLCALKSTSGRFQIDLVVESKNSVTAQFTTMIDIRNACEKNVSINLLGEVSQ